LFDDGVIPIADTDNATSTNNSDNQNIDHVNNSTDTVADIEHGDDSIDGNGDGNAAVADDEQGSDVDEYASGPLDADVETKLVEEELRGKNDAVVAPDSAPRLAIVGRPNVGKSSLLNAVIGEQRSVVSAIAGTTSDPVDQYLVWRDTTPMTLVDTAGIRRRSKHLLGMHNQSCMGRYGVRMSTN
jgi:predicted GTPase